ncbi:ATP synthase A chain domain-containing protein [Ditylenchus destructor]|nr:ATP synthase A chain domain-containing protein [Ditylenchus destructor]
MDMLPVDALPSAWTGYVASTGHDPHHAYMRVVPTADLSTTLGMSTFVLLLCFFYNIKIKGLGGWAHELIAAPFGDHWALWPFNFLMQVLEFIAKTVSHGMRLFGNMFGGEIVFLLIALLGGGWALTGTGIGLAIGHVIAGTVWMLFHLLVIPLQAFIFMMLTLIYLGQAHDAH